MLSYTIVLLITVIIFFIVYTQIETIVADELSNSNVSLLRQVQQSIDNQITDIRTLSLEIALNNRLFSLMGIKGRENMKLNNNYDIFQILKDLSIYKTVNGNTEDFYIYLKNIDTVLSPTSACKQNTFLTILSQDYGINEEQWNKLVNVGTADFMPIYIKNKQRESVRDIVYVQPIPIRKSSEKLGAIVILLNEKRFETVITNISKNSSGNFLILNKNDEILAETDQHSLVSQAIKYENLNSDWGILWDTLNGNKVVVSYVTSGITGWKYVSIMNVDIYMEKVSFARRMIVVGVIACFLIGGLISYLFLKRNYNPINAIIQTLEKKLGIKVDNKYNEYNFIQETIQNTFDEKNVIDIRLRQQNMAMRSNFIARLITGKTPKNYSIDELLKNYDIHFSSSYFAVIILHIEDYSRLFSEEEIANNKEDLEKLSSTLSNVFEGLANQRNNGFMTEIDDMQVCLVNFNESEVNDAQRELLDLCLGMQKILEESFNIYLSISISNIHMHLDGIPQAYREALEAMEYRIVDDNKKIFSYGEISERNPNYYDFSKIAEQQIINSIKTGNSAEAKKALDEILNEYISNKSFSMRMIKYLLFDLINSILKAMVSISIESQNYFFNELNPLEKIQKCETLKEIKTQMASTIQCACDYVEKKKKSHNSVLKDSVVSFIENNYMDINLNVKMIADKFEMNPVYISRFAKEQLGDSLLDYINKCRLSKAKQMLKSGKLTANEIAKQAGYCNISTFIRVFKKYEGMTPGQFKKNGY